ncbi:amino acid transporter [Aspergillus sclerotioniger CBS 115572]|uniref:Amino acid transporter n=1 Tax=Aspergillus sclerotioniger CBS 115572 TaxID=1450535 RepID=A0A317XC49_9EURO|nr:amino acid transporter [Aspergillus sclerotioniger CBS 115572]PWY96113.1 amino acid transporter [Aspergillus sclerotioniger CBS 115572]
MTANDDDEAPLLRDPPLPVYGGLEGPPPTAHQPSFKRNLGTAEAFSIIISIVIGSGIFTSPGAIDSNVPSPGAALIVWLAGGILAWTGAATMAELGTAIPGEGGVQPYLQYIFGDVFGFLAAWTWVIAIVPASLAIASIVFVESIYSAVGVTDRSGKLTHKALAMLVIIVIGMANSVSTQFTTCLNRFFVMTKFAAILAIVTAAFGVVLSHLVGWNQTPQPESHDWLTRSWFGPRNTVTLDGSEIDWSKLSGWETLGHCSAALYSALWAYSGWDKVIYVSAELSAPARQLPLTINTAIPIVILSFIAVNVAYYILLPWGVVSTTDSVAVIQTSFSHLLGPVFGIAAAALICLVVAGSLLGCSFVASRMVVAAAKSDWLPGFLGRIGSVSGQSTSTADAPVNAIIFNTVCTVLYILFGNFRALVTFNGLAEYTFFFLAMVGAIILRIREPQLHRPYKPFIFAPILFNLVSGLVVTRGAIFAPMQAVVLIGVWAVGLGFYGGRRKWLRRGGKASSRASTRH